MVEKSDKGLEGSSAATPKRLKVELSAGVTAKSKKECKRSLVVKIISEKNIGYGALTGTLSYIWKCKKGYTIGVIIEDVTDILEEIKAPRPGLLTDSGKKRKIDARRAPIVYCPHDVNAEAGLYLTGSSEVDTEGEDFGLSEPSLKKLKLRVILRLIRVLMGWRQPARSGFHRHNEDYGVELSRGGELLDNIPG